MTLIYTLSQLYPPFASTPCSIATAIWTSNFVFAVFRLDFALSSFLFPLLLSLAWIVTDISWTSVPVLVLAAVIFQLLSICCKLHMLCSDRLNYLDSYRHDIGWIQ